MKQPLSFNNILIVGATSAIALETATLFAKKNCSFFLVARNEAKLAAAVSLLEKNGASQIGSHISDIYHFDNHKTMLEKAWSFLGDIDLLLIAHGTLPDQKKCELSFAETHKSLQTNFLSTVSILTEAANIFELKKQGTIAVISSVAGDRGRQSNYIYGAAKGALTIFLQGLRNRLYKSQVHVLTIKPGFVSTPLTSQLPQGKLYAPPSVVARDIYKAIVKQKDEVYTPSFWLLLMSLIKAIPESVFKRLKL